MFLKPKMLIRNILKLLGFKIIRINSPNAQGIPIESPILYNSKEQINAFYSDPEAVEEYLEPKRLDFYEKIVNISDKKHFDFQNKIIADIGCGTGHFLLKVEEYLRKNRITATLYGLEFSEVAIQIAKEIVPHASFIQHDIYTEYRQKNEFDIIYCLEVLEHLLYPEKAMKNIVKMCSNCGKIFITVPDGRLDTFEGHINFWSPEGWKVFIEQSCDWTGLDFEIGLFDKTNYAILCK